MFANLSTGDELNRIKNKQFDKKRLNHARDIFLFSCYTGLAYNDVYKLRIADIMIGIDGDKWIITTGKKLNQAQGFYYSECPGHS